MRHEEGWALLSAMAVLAVTALLGLALLSLVDGQTHGSRVEREQESGFNLGEAALQAQLLRLANPWPARAELALPDRCVPDSASALCPDASELKRSYSGPDYGGASWEVLVRDDGAGTGDYYDPGAAKEQPSWDANGNGRLWAHARAVARGRHRAIATLVQAIRAPEPFPRNIVTAGYFRVTNSARKVIVDTQGDEAQPAALAVRCEQPAPSECLDYAPDRGHVSPDTGQPGHSGAALPEEAIERLRARARELGTYHAEGCPKTPSGELVFVEAGSCAYAGGGSANSASAPGAFVVADGTFSIGGSARFHGLVYALNRQLSSAEVVSVQGTAQIVGAIAVDGAGGVAVGSSGRNLVFDDAVFGRPLTTRSADAVPGSWREVPAR